MKQFSDENNGKYFSGETEIDDYVVISHLNYKIIFDKYLHYQLYKGQPNDQEYSRVRLEFESPDQLKFNLKLRTYTDSFNELFGPDTIKTRDKQFDRKFVLKGNNESKILAIFKDERIRHLTLQHGELKLGILYNKGMFGEQIP
ncbi:MAG: hypothetical protein IT236_15940, partial [Bacteroidia bacterium]|nr:hypothetical protein [Bacteroidia bacterium]